MSGAVNLSEGPSDPTPVEDTLEVKSNNKHQPGKLVGNDKVETFHAETLPPGTAPASRTFQPNPTDDVPPAQQSLGEGEQASAQDTIAGATSADVHTGLGHPGSGQSSKELRHDGQASRKNPGAGGVEGVGASASQSTIDQHDPAHANQRALDKDEARIGRSDVPGAHERVPESAEAVASERN